MLTDFHNSFTDRLASKFAITATLNTPPHVTNVATLPCEISQFKKCRTQGLNESNCRISYSKSLSKYTCIVMMPLFSDKDTLSGHAKNIPPLTVRNCHDKEKMPRQKSQLTSGRSVTDNVNLSVSESNWSTASSYLSMIKSELLCIKNNN